MLSPITLLRAVKMVHTIVWAFFAGCVFAIPVVAWRNDFHRAALLIGIVFVETFVLAANGGRCPLTGMAARYTDDRRDNFAGERQDKIISNGTKLSGFFRKDFIDAHSDKPDRIKKRLENKRKLRQLSRSSGLRRILVRALHILRIQFP